jgi:uncharacterized protein DUF2806
MGDSHSIINLGDLTKPANTLIEKISDAIGGIFKPIQIVRVAEAEAKAETIRAATQIEVTELQRRAMRRFIMEEAKKQNNIENITAKALPELGEQASPEKLENDWIANFFDKCRLISDEEMQSLWAKILAGEANSPGNFSKRTIDLLASMDKSDARLFTQLCMFGFRFDKIYLLIYDTEAEIYTDTGINFGTLSHLESIGLIHFNNQVGYLRKRLPQVVSFDYFDRKVSIEFPIPEDNKLHMGKAIFTKAGDELAPICGAQPRDGFFDYVIEKWKGFGYTIQQEADQRPVEH